MTDNGLFSRRVLHIAIHRAIHSPIRAAMSLAICGLLSGCAQPKVAAPTPAAPTPVAVKPSPATTTAAAEPESTVSTSPANEPNAVERRAREQAAAIEALMAGRSAPPSTEPEIPAPPMPVERPKLPAPVAPMAAPVAIAPPPVTITDVPPPPPAPPSPNAEGPVANAATPAPSSPDLANRAVPPVPPGPARGDDNSLAARIEAKAAQNPRDVAAQLDQQLLGLIQGRSVPTPETLGTLATDDREMLTSLMDGLSNFRAGVAADGNMLMTRKIRPLVDMTDRLQAESDLTISTAVLCSDIKAFGIYTPIDPPKFPALSASRFYIYVEVSNFMSKLNSSNLYVTNLHQDLVLYTESGMAVKTLSSSNVADVSRTRRHDFFLRTVIDLPPTLTTGRHVIKVTIVDQNASHVSETTIPLSIVAK